MNQEINHCINCGDETNQQNFAFISKTVDNGKVSKEMVLCRECY